MSDGSLSQEEIDALLAGAEDLGSSFEAGESAGGLGDDEQGELQTLSSRPRAIHGGHARDDHG